MLGHRLCSEVEMELNGTKSGMCYLPCLLDLCGTPGYLSPEALKVSMIDNARGYGKPVDMLVGC